MLPRHATGSQASHQPTVGEGVWLIRAQPHTNTAEKTEALRLLVCEWQERTSSLWLRRQDAHAVAEGRHAVKAEATACQQRTPLPHRALLAASQRHHLGTRNQGGSTNEWRQQVQRQ